MPAPRVSLRLKLAAWFLGVFALAFTIVVACALHVHRRWAQHQLDARMEDIARGVADMVRSDGREPWMTRFDSLQPTERTFIVLAVRDEHGAVLASQWRVDRSALLPVPDDDDGDVVVRSLSVERSRRLLGRAVPGRIVTYRSMLPDGRHRYIDLAADPDVERDARFMLLGVVWIGVLGALVGGGVAAWMIAGRAVRPMWLLADAAERIDPVDVSRRIDVRGRECEIERLRNAMNEALARLEAGFRAQQQFVGDVAHDLRTPIATLLAESQVLAVDRSSPRALEDYRRSVIEELRRLGGLVESHLALASADRGEILARTTDVDAVDLAIDSVAQCEAEAGRARVHVAILVDEPPGDAPDRRMRGDPDLLRAMLVNVVRNAIQHAPPDSSVHVRLAADASSHRFEVTDRGPGIPEAQRETIFDRFVTLRRSASGERGTGLGLAIARSVARFHRGTIELGNREGGGCVCVIAIPRASGAAATPTTANGSDGRA